ncbi:MAG: tetraacyldisaccharide 4'-kinase [Desulfobacteraceae bacterium]|jgi:tetraacyldisaccharide 4'-kinase
MQNLRKKAIAVINSNKSYSFLSLATLLFAGSLLYSIAARSRGNLYARGFLPKFKLSCPVISVGNLTVGGTGKTPMTIELAGWLQQQGLKAAIVSRGYKGLSEKKIAVVCDGASILCDVHQAGDEPFLMAKRLKGVPIVVGKDRFAAGSTAIKRFQPDVILLDDAFQHQRLERDLNLLLLDAQAPFGNGFMLPRGALREPVSSVLRADAIVFTRCRETPSPYYNDIARKIKPRAIFDSFHKPVIRCVLPPMQPIDADALIQASAGGVNHLSDRRIFAFSGLARNETFWKTISDLGGHLIGKMGFADHHAYRPEDIKTILHLAQQVGSDCIATTEKDYVRLPKEMPLPMELIVLGISIDFGEDQGRWQQFVAKKLGGLTGRF